MAREFSKAFYRSKEWQSVRGYVLARDMYLCRHCGKPAEEVHHKIHLSPSNICDITISLNPDNLVSLCKDCHFAEHREDKARGIREKNNVIDCGEEYEFDEEGFIVRKSSPPLHQKSV